MLGKTKTGRGFKGAVNYCLQKVKNPELLDMNNIAHTDKKGIIKEFVSLSSTNSDVSKPVWHSSLSFANSDNITNEKMVEIANRFMEKAGFDKDNNQWFIVKHNDTQHQHCHIVANRIGFDGKTIDDYYFKSRTVQWAKEIEIEYNLTKVQDIANKVRQEVNKIHPDLDKERIKKTILKTLGQSNIDTFSKFQESLQKQGVGINILSHKTTGDAYGITFSVGEKVFKGSDIGKQFAFKALSNVLSFTPVPIPALNVIKVAANIISKGMGI